MNKDATKLGALFGMISVIMVTFGDEPGNPFYGAEVTTRLIVGGMLAVVAAIIGAAIGFVIDLARRKK